MDGILFWRGRQPVAVSQFTGGFRRADVASDILDGRESVRFQHLAANVVDQDRAGNVPELEHAAGFDVSGAGEDKLRRSMEQSGRAAVCSGHKRFNLRRGRSGGLLPDTAPALMK